MVNQTYSAALGDTADLLSGLARTRLVNYGQDTKITFDDGSSIVLKGVTHADAVFVPADAGEPQSRRQFAAR